MDWTPYEFNVNVEVQNYEAFCGSNFQCQGAADFVPSNLNLLQQRENDQHFIRNFILGKQQSINPSKTNKIKISDAKSILLEIISEKKSIEKSVLNLDVNDVDFNLKWKMLVMQLNDLNKKLLKFNAEVKIPLAKSLTRRLKKRKAIRKRKEKVKELKNKKEEKIREKHRIIDKILNERSEEVEEIKHEAALKRQADTVLHEVQRKKYEARKMLNLLVALAKLRELRSKEEEKLGGYCSKQLTETFNKVMLRFQNLWEKQLEVYKLEEKGLKIMLEENTLPHKKESKFETNLLQWKKILFGDFSYNEHEKLLTLADTNIQALIEVRRNWDQFLTTDSALMASSIPLGWVLPPETEDENWKAFIKSGRKISL